MNFGFFGPKMAVSWRTSAFQKKRAWNPYCYSVFWVRAFWAKVSKKEISKSHQEKWKNLTDNWKAIFWYFCCFFWGLTFFLVFWIFFFFSVCFVLFVFFGVFLWRVYGSGEVARRATSLALNPPYFFFLYFLFCFLVFFFEGLRVRWGGPLGHLTWP